MMAAVLQCCKKEVLRLDLCKPNCVVPSWSLLPLRKSKSKHASKHVAIKLPAPQAHTVMYMVLCHTRGPLHAQRK